MVLPVSPTRRGALAVLCGGALLLAGCDWPGGAPEPGATRAPDPDLGVLEAVEAALGDVEALVAGVLAAHPGLGVSLGGWQALHGDHRAVLATASRQGSSASPDPRPEPDVPARAPRALAAVRTAEASYAASLAASAGLVRSGPFARLLAVMSAGVRQHLAADAPEAP